MKKLILLFTAVAISHSTVFSQSCLPEGITFTTQAQVDSFPINYPGCTEIEGNMLICDYEPGNITNLNGLSALTSIGGNLSFGTSYALTNLIGLDNVTSVGGNLLIGDSRALTNLIGLDNVTSIGGDLEIVGNYSLTSLTGLENLTYIGGYLYLYGNPFTSMTGLESLTSIGEYFYFFANPALTNLTGLENLTAIGESLVISYNTTLTSLAGLENIDSGSISSLTILENTLLSTCEVKSICDYLASPNGTIEIHDNAPGCDSPEEVEAACQVGFEDTPEKGICTIYPNPSSGQFTVEFYLQQPSLINLVVLNSLGQVVATLTEGVLAKGTHQVFWSSGNLPIGIYYCRLQTGNQNVTNKIIKIQ